MLRVRSYADLIEIRLDYFSNLNKENAKEIISEIISKKPCPLIMTCRKNEEGGKFLGSEEERIAILENCIDLKSDYVDIELSCEKDVIKKLISKRNNTKIIVSYHNFESILSNLDELYDEIKSTGCDIIKIACMANSLSDNLKIFNLIKKSKEEGKDIIALCMGEYGKISRILNIKYGSYLTFGYLDKGKESAPGQISVEHLKYIYRADKLNKDTKIYGLIGRPVSESRGFIIHNITFKEKEINAVYVNFLVDNLEEFLSNFKSILSGFSVTMPYKKEVISYLDDISKSAKEIGAVNTIIIQAGKLKGYNTDIDGAILAIKENPKNKIAEKNVVMIGAGGVARAIGYGMIHEKGKLTIVNRTTEKGKLLAEELGCKFDSVDDIEWSKIDLLINATSIGMTPKINESPIDGRFLKNMIVFDSVYNPLITKMLSMAERNGCTTISGLKMFVYQAALQFELFTGQIADIGFMEETVMEHVAS